MEGLRVGVKGQVWSTQIIWREIGMAEWPLQDAKNMFSAVVNAALAGEPQRVTRRGQPAVVVLATEGYERLSLATCVSSSRRGFLR